jgi:creatinine amidohydrolase
MFPDELEAALAGCPVCYLPYGLCEPHGPQNALGMDALRAHAYAVRAAKEFGGIVAPPCYWHIHDFGIYAAWAENRVGQARPWLSAVPPWLWFKNVCYQLRSADALGFQAVIGLTGHAGPHAEDLAFVQDVMQRHIAARIALVPCTRITDASMSHAGAVETSLLWAVEPDCVDVSRIPPADAPGPHFAMAPDAGKADRREGERLLDGIVSRLGGIAKALLADFPRDEERSPLSFGELEHVWAEEIGPELSGFYCMQQDRRGGGEPPPPEDSQWRLNWRVPE